MRPSGYSLVKVREVIRNLVPTINETHHKGSLGRICVVGGSEMYCGAPYFAALAALKMGADLSYIICPKAASVPIKCYNPDMMVLPYLDDEANFGNVLKLLKGSSSVVLGPGLGREDAIIKPLKIIVKFLQESRKNVVVDADALWFLSKNCDFISGISSPTTFVMTPNRNEFKRLLCNFEICNGKIDDQLVELSKLTGMSVLLKGNLDLFCDSNETHILNDSAIPQCFKRCGGQGDMLGGILALFMHWYNIKNPDKQIGKFDDSALLECSVAASNLVKITASATFKEKGLSICTGDIINNIGSVLSSM